MLKRYLKGISDTSNRGVTAQAVEKETELLQLLEKFFSFSIPKVYNAKTLAIELAKRTRFLYEEIEKQVEI